MSHISSMFLIVSDIRDNKMIYDRHIVAIY